MSPRILFLLAGAAALAVAFNSDRVDAAVVNSEAGNVPYKYGCKYHVSSVWNDIIFLIDRSGTYGEFAQLYYTMSQIMEPFSVAKIGSNNMAMVRFGITFFNSYNSGGNDFGHTLKSDIPNINTFKYYEPYDKQSNIDMALKSAEAQFANSDRPNARKVIVLLTQTLMYNSTVAERLKSKGFIINVYSLQNPAAFIRTSNIQNLASPSYFTNSITNTVADLQTLQARANCFCDPKRDSFISDNVTGVPTGGCYGTPFATPLSSYPNAVSMCTSSFHGTVAVDKSQQKNTFLNKENKGTSPFYIGLKWSDDYLAWMWEDGTTLSTGDFNLFPKKVIPTPFGDYKCVYQDPSKNQWALTACRNSMKYFCEFAPCDSTNYYCSN